MQYKCNINSCKYNVNSTEIIASVKQIQCLFLELSEFFFPNILGMQLVESTEAEPIDIEGRV